MPTPEPNHDEIEQPNEQTSTSAGGDIVQGDKVGQDKITVGDASNSQVAVGRNASVSVVIQQILKPKNVVIGFVVIALIGLGLLLLSKLLPETIPSPFPTPAAFEPAADGKTLIVVLPFASDGEDDTPDIHYRIHSSIESSIADLNLTDDVRVEIDPHAALHRDDREGAQALGEQYGAAVIIWGTKTAYDVTVKFLNIKELESPAGDEQVQIVAPDEFAEFVVRDLPEQLTFLSLFAVGQAVVAEGELAAAIPIMEEAVANISEEMIAKEFAAPKAAAAAYYRLGWLYHVPPTQKFQHAAEAYEQSLVFEPEGTASLGNLGLVYRSLGEYETATSYHEQALAIAQSIGDKESEGNQLGNLGIVYASLGEYEMAATFMEQALAITQLIGDKESEGNQLGNLGIVYRSLGEYETAMSYHEQSLVIAQVIGDKQRESANLGNLGSVYRSLGDYETAASYMKQALVIAQAIGDKQSEGIHLGNLGSVYFLLGDYETAASYHEQALVIAQAIGDKQSEGNHLGNLGLVYFSLGDYETATSYHKQALAIAQAIGDKGNEGNHLGNLGLVYYNTGEYETAVTYAQQALTLFEEIGSPNAATAQRLLDMIQAEIDGR